MRKRSIGETKESQNQDINHHNEARRVFPILLRIDGEVLGLIFTPNQLRVAHDRWNKNPNTRVKHSGIKEVRDLLRGGK